MTSPINPESRRPKPAIPPLGSSGASVRGRTPSTSTTVQYLRRCKWCGCVHDTGKVTVLARHADCSVWACPGCGVQIDDRPAGWGGSYAVEDPATTSAVQRCSNACYTNGICTCRRKP